MNRGDAIQSVTHVADVDCYPCSGLNKSGSSGLEVRAEVGRSTKRAAPGGTDR